MNIKKASDASTAWSALKIKIIDSGYACVGAEWNDVNVRPPYSRLYYIIDGEGIAESGKQQRLALQKGRVYLLPAGTMLHYSCPERMTQLYFHLETRTVDGYDLFSRAGGLMEIPAEADAAALCADYLSGDYLRQIRVRCRVETDAARFIAASGLEKTLMRPRSPFLQAVFRAVRSQLRSSLTIAEIARTLSISESALTKRFRSEFGMPLGRYIDEMLAQEIASRLLSTQQSVRDIAEQLDFCDQFYLSRFFSAHRGMSPSAYRASLQEQI